MELVLGGIQAVQVRGAGTALKKVVAVREEQPQPPLPLLLLLPPPRRWPPVRFL